jgi:hypothetical protein
MSKQALGAFQLDNVSGDWVCLKTTAIPIKGTSVNIAVHEGQRFSAHTVFAGHDDFVAYLESIAVEGSPPDPAAKKEARRAKLKNPQALSPAPTGMKRWLLALAPIVIGLAISLILLLTAVDRGNILFVFLPAVALSARIGGIGPGIAALVLTALVVNYFIIPPTFAFDLSPEWMGRYFIFLLSALGVGFISIPSIISRPQADRRSVAPAIPNPDPELLRARKILIMGNAGSGKTTLANALVPLLKAVHFNGDEMRANITRELGFSHLDRLEQARRMGWLCDRIVAAGGYAVADFICPTEMTRQAFGDAFIVWVDRVSEGRFADTNAMFEPPIKYDVRVPAEGSPEYWAGKILEHLASARQAQNSTADQSSSMNPARCASQL